MNRRWAVLTLVVAAAVPLAASCSSDDDDLPSDPSVSLFRGTPNPNVSTDVTG